MVSVSETGHEDDQHKRCSDIQLGETEPGVENKRNAAVVSEREHEGMRGQPQKYGPHRKVGRPPKLVKDTDCPQEFVTRGLLHNHVKTNHSAEAESLMCYFLCPQCGKTFTFKHNLAVHLRRHQSIKPYACSHCQSSFTAAVDLNHHVAQKHCDARPFVCSICAKSFKVYPGLRRHMQTHGGTREYTCHICGKLFTRRSNVKQHIAAIHTAMKPYKCHLCEAAYTRKSGLGLHLRSARHRSCVADNGTAETTGTS
ncbi:hypothetical protein BaRGS_00039733 [Batillaria attramentaria]|uniref:C2H2-type domain-containing protein n=1 Tax=Batillaria attramentaria TaxID=370345 RepID=A0ABD0J2M8_9CAEN